MYKYKLIIRDSKGEYKEFEFNHSVKNELKNIIDKINNKYLNNKINTIIPEKDKK